MHLSFSSWSDFETFCCFWLSDIVKRTVGHQVTYHVYGNGLGGEGQSGIDIVPAYSGSKVVGQAKRWDRKPYRWRDVERDLTKTDEYPGEISEFVIMTTAARHTSVQNRLETETPYVHTRANGTSFRVFIFYTSSLNDVNFLPDNVRRRLFPMAFQIAAPSPNNRPITSYTDSLDEARRVLPAIMGGEILSWLETWDFSAGFVQDEPFSVLRELAHDIGAVDQAARLGIDELLREGNRLALWRCRPAANGLFEWVVAFVEQVLAHIIGAHDDRYGEILALAGLQGSPFELQRIANNWATTAHALATEYRQLVLGARGL